MSLPVNNLPGAGRRFAQRQGARRELRCSPEHPETLTELFCVLVECEIVTVRFPISSARCSKPQFLFAATEVPVKCQNFRF